MAGNIILQKAKNGKKDEFYTQTDDIAKEMAEYTDFFKGKRVLCNCNDGLGSKFHNFLYDNFHILGLKKLTCISYDGEGRGRKYVYVNDMTFVMTLNGTGDFASEECITELDDCDVVVTNPPFSLFRKFVTFLMEHKKKFLIVGNMNAVTCKDIFPYIKSNEMWYGHSISSGDRAFRVPDDYPLEAAGCGVDDKGHKYIRVKGVRWFTNIDHNKRHQPIELTAHYTASDYPMYDNYAAIECSKTSSIPMDYDGVMGVPISFLDKFCPEQFDIIGITENNKDNDYLHIEGCDKYDRPYLNGKRMYSRILIRRK